MHLQRRQHGPATSKWAIAACLVLLLFAVISFQDASIKDMELTTQLLIQEFNNVHMEEVSAGSQRKNINPVTSLRSTLFQRNIYIEDAWLDLIQEGSALLKAGSSSSPPVGIVMEVGMHRAVQCLQAASAGLEAHCVEPSPASFTRVKAAVRTAKQETKNRVHLYQVAAGERSGGTIPFVSSGGTGDHVGQHDMWKMEETAPVEGGGTVIQVPVKRLDDIVKEAGGEVFLLKVDTQGFEPTVFSGLSESLQQHKVKYVLFEYWPRGMDFLAGKKDQCIGAKLLQDFADMGYTLYAFGVSGMFIACLVPDQSISTVVRIPHPHSFLFLLG
jgi:FkbM family methyltransferase